MTREPMHRRNEIDSFRSEMEELFADLCQVPRLVGRRRAFRPRVDAYRTEEPPQLTIVVELAGVDPSEVEVTVADGVLLVAGIRRREVKDRAVYRHIELDYGPFERRIPLGERVDENAIEAVYDRGLLRITLPTVQPRGGKVQVEVTRGRNA